MAVNPYAAPSADFNAGVAAEAPLAGRGARFGAFLIDHILVGIPASIGFVITGAANGKGLGLVIGVALTLALMIYQAVLVSSTGQTLAKKWLGIRIVKMDGSPVDFVSAVLLRYVVGQLVLNSLGPYFLIDSCFIFREDHRCIHDLIASTKVVEAR